MKNAIVGTWIIFALAVLTLDWHNAAPIHLAILALGLVGLTLSVIWRIRGGKWKYACLAMSIALLAGYGVWWFVELLNHYSADSSAGLTGAIGLHLQIVTSVLQRQFANGHWLAGSAEFYWLVGMPLIQALVIVLMVGSPKVRESRESAQ
jgi:hypothetical protein